MSTRRQNHIKPQQRFKSKEHKVFPEEISKIAFSDNDDKGLQIFFIKITSYPYGANAEKVCKTELLQ